MNSVALPDPASVETMTPVLGVPLAPAAVPRHVARRLVTGTSALGLGIAIERGFGFLANILAARFAGLPVFGAYSLAISTANNISTYAAGGIGATAARFSGKYPRGSAGYSTLGRALAIVSVVSALVAAAGLWLGARPLARLLHKPGLSSLLAWAAVSAAGIILLECARGFFVGQRRLAALVLLSLVVGVGMVTLLPLAAHHHSPVRMILSQGLITTSAVVLCLALFRPLRLAQSTAATVAPALPLAPMLGEVWRFGFVQLGGLVAANLAGWWVTTLVARADTTLVQMSFFAIASQMRNLVGLAPGLLTESSYAVMADPDGERDRTPHQVMAVCTYAATCASFVLAAAGIILVPWLLHLLYGHSYTAASATVAVALAIAVAHMGNAPAAARLSIVSIRLTGVINTVWAFFVAVAGTLVLLHRGTATLAMVIYFAAHVLSAALVLFALTRRDFVPKGMPAVFALGTATTTLLALGAVLRSRVPAHAPALTCVMCLVAGAASLALWLLGRSRHWLPSPAALRHLAASVVARLRPLSRNGGAHA